MLGPLGRIPLFLFVVIASASAGCGAPSAGDASPAAPRTPPASDAGGAPPDAPATPPADAAAPDASDAAPPAPRTGPLAGVARVWAVHDGEKIDRDDLTNPASLGNDAWDGGKIRLFGARNEVLAFQVVVESTSAGVRALSAALPILTRRGGTESIAYAPPDPADPAAYAGRPIQLFTENYLHVTAATSATWAFAPGSPAAPSNPLGWKPVQLVPENARAGLGGLPIDVAPLQNQAIWIEVYTGRDLPAGVYDGAVTLTVGGAARDVPVELTLYDFALPDDPPMKAMLYFEPEQVDAYMGTAPGLVERFHRFAHRSRVELVNAYDAAAVDAALGRFDGSAFTAAHGYAGPGESTGNRIVPATFYGPGTAYDTEAGAWSTADAWMSMLAAKIPGATTFVYMPDEPSSSEFPYMQTIAQNLHSDPGPGGALATFATTPYSSALDGAIDIWCPSPFRFDVARAASERARGRKTWFYNGGRPNAGVILIDAPATDPRVVGWAGFKENVEVYYYWHADMWRHNAQKVDGDRNQNVWVDPITFDNRGQPGKSDTGFLDGDGVLIYPGSELVHPDQDRGIAGPIASIQLANLRRGLEDNAYLALARQRGKEGDVTSALQAIVPRVFSEAGSTVSFPEHGDAFERARRALADAIVAP